MTVERSTRPVPAERLARAARRLLDASRLCAISTVAEDGTAHVNTAYFAWSGELELVWLSDPEATHSRNVEERRTAAVAIYDSRQSWGRPDRGIQLFGAARRAGEDESRDAHAVYADRFSRAADLDPGSYRFYVFRPERVKLFDERDFGAGWFVIATVDDSGALAWEATEIYRSASGS